MKCQQLVSGWRCGSLCYPTARRSWLWSPHDWNELVLCPGCDPALCLSSAGIGSSVFKRERKWLDTVYWQDCMCNVEQRKLRNKDVHSLRCIEPWEYRDLENCIFGNIGPWWHYLGITESWEQLRKYRPMESRGATDMTMEIRNLGHDFPWIVDTRKCINNGNGNMKSNNAGPKDLMVLEKNWIVKQRDPEALTSWNTGPWGYLPLGILGLPLDP